MCSCDLQQIKLLDLIGSLSRACAVDGLPKEHVRGSNMNN